MFNFVCYSGQYIIRILDSTDPISQRMQSQHNIHQLRRKKTCGCILTTWVDQLQSSLQWVISFNGDYNLLSQSISSSMCLIERHGQQEWFFLPQLLLPILIVVHHQNTKPSKSLPFCSYASVGHGKISFMKQIW